MTNIDLYRGMMDPTLSPAIQMLQLASAHVAARAIHTYAAAGVADVLGIDPKGVTEIAEEAGVRVPELYRLLRFLSTIGIVSEEEPATFVSTPLGDTLRSRGFSLIRDNTRLIGSDFYWAALAGLENQVRTGQIAFEATTGTPLFKHLAGNPEDAEIFNAAMDALSAINIPALLSAYDFSRFRKVVDIAGGKGALLRGILAKHRELQGVLFDFESVLRGVATEKDLYDRMEMIPGNFLESIPKGGDGYILRQVLHNWDDGNALRILTRCREAIAESGRLLIVEMAPPPAMNAGNNWAAFDLLMMVLMGGHERTLMEFRGLLATAGFILEDVIPTRSAFSILECRVL